MAHINTHGEYLHLVRNSQCLETTIRIFFPYTSAPDPSQPILPASYFGHGNIGMIYRANGFAVFRSCGCRSERKLVLRFSTGVYESDTLFTLMCIKYWSYQQTVSEKKFCFDNPHTQYMLFWKFCEPVAQIKSIRVQIGCYQGVHGLLQF